MERVLNTNNTVIWSCDPGANGAFVRMVSLTDWLVFLTKKGYREAYNTMLVDECDKHITVYGVTEDLSMRVGDLKKAKSITAMLKNAGRGLLCFELSNTPYEEIAPKTWQYDFGLVGYEYSERKKLAVKIATYYFGDATLADADAKLIALHKYWKLKGIVPPRRAKEIITRLTITKEIYR